MYPENLKYTAQHEWVRPAESAEAPVRVGITDFAQESLGDIVFVTLPDVGANVSAGEACGEVESTKSVSDLYAPISGTVTAVNDALEGTPELVNSDAYGEGWLMEMRPADPDEVPGLLDAATYQAGLDQS